MKITKIKNDGLKQVYDIPVASVFEFDGYTYMRLHPINSEDNCNVVNLVSGVAAHLPRCTKVRPCPNAELLINYD